MIHNIKHKNFTGTLWRTNELRVMYLADSILCLQFTDQTYSDMVFYVENIDLHIRNTTI